MDTSTAHQMRGFRALAAELHVDIKDFCAEAHNVPGSSTDEQVVQYAISNLAPDDKDYVTSCWRWLSEVIRSTRTRPATPTDFLYLGMCKASLYSSLLRRWPPALQLIGGRPADTTDCGMVRFCNHDRELPTCYGF